MSKGYVEVIFDRYVKGTPKEAVVRDMTIKLGTLTNEVRRSLSLPTSNVHITTRVIKKNYDKRPAEENDFILKHGWEVIYNPDAIYRNKDGKRGDFAFVKRIKDKTYFASIEQATYGDEPILYVVSLFRLPKPDNYLRSYDLMWSWKGGDPSS